MQSRSPAADSLADVRGIAMRDGDLAGSCGRSLRAPPDPRKGPKSDGQCHEGLGCAVGLDKRAQLAAILFRIDHPGAERLKVAKCPGHDLPDVIFVVGKLQRAGDDQVSRLVPIEPRLSLALTATVRPWRTVMLRS